MMEDAMSATATHTANKDLDVLEDQPTATHHSTTAMRVRHVSSDSVLMEMDVSHVQPTSTATANNALLLTTALLPITTRILRSV